MYDDDPRLLLPTLVGHSSRRIQGNDENVDAGVVAIRAGWRDLRQDDRVELGQQTTVSGREGGRDPQPTCTCGRK